MKLIKRIISVIFILTEMHKLFLKFLQFTYQMMEAGTTGNGRLPLFYPKEGELILNESAVHANQGKEEKRWQRKNREGKGRGGEGKQEYLNPTWSWTSSGLHSHWKGTALASFLKDSSKVSVRLRVCSPRRDFSYGQTKISLLRVGKEMFGT